MRQSLLRRNIAKIYEAKVHSDIAKRDAGHPVDELPDFVINDFMFNMYGVKSLVREQVKQLILGIRKYGKSDRRVNLFGQVCCLTHLTHPAL